jgi:hypothetical protein
MLLKYNKKKILYGGEEILSSQNQIQTFLSIIILGYFGIKVVYGLFFNFYPTKFYYRNIEVTTNEETSSESVTEKITLNAYVPGMWNNEMTDFITLLGLSAIIYIYTNVSGKSFIDINGNLSLTFIFGYIIGLGYPPFINNYNKEIIKTSNIKYIVLIVIIFFIIGIVIINYQSIDQPKHKLNYLVYFIVIILTIFGLIFSRKLLKSYNSVTYFNNNGNNCTFNKNGVVQLSYESINITTPFVVFIILLLFSYEPQDESWKNLYVFIYALLLGILVSSISYYGIEYFLQKYPEKQCNDENECKLKEMPNPATETTNQVNEEEKVEEKKTTVSLLKIIIIIFIVLIITYLIYFYIKK